MGYSEIAERGLPSVYIGGSVQVIRQTLKQVLGAMDLRVEDVPYPDTRLGRWAKEQPQLRAWPLCNWNQMGEGIVLWVCETLPSLCGVELEDTLRLRVMRYLRNGRARTGCIALAISGEVQVNLVGSRDIRALPLSIPQIIRFLVQRVDLPFDNMAASVSAEEFRASLTALTHCLKNPELWNEHRTGLIALFRILEADCERLGVDDGKKLCHDSINYWESGGNAGQADLRRQWGIFHDSCLEAGTRLK